MELTVYWTHFAEHRLEEIYNYYDSVAGKQIAQNLITSIIDKTISLDRFPHIGQVEELLIDRSENFKYLIHKNYKIIYWINTAKNRIDIVHVFDTRQNPSKMKEIE